GKKSRDPYALAVVSAKATCQTSRVRRPGSPGVIAASHTKGLFPFRSWPRRNGNRPLETKQQPEQGRHETLWQDLSRAIPNRGRGRSGSGPGKSTAQRRLGGVHRTGNPGQVPEGNRDQVGVRR